MCVKKVENNRSTGSWRTGRENLGILSVAPTSKLIYGKAPEVTKARVNTEGANHACHTFHAVDELNIYAIRARYKGGIFNLAVLLMYPDHTGPICGLSFFSNLRWSKDKTDS
jgi:hypothetical protein